MTLGWNLPPARLGGTLLYILLSINGCFLRMWIKGGKSKNQTPIICSPSFSISLSVVVSLCLFCLCLFRCFIHKTRISSQYQKGWRLNERGAVADFVSHCSFLWAGVLCSLNVYTEEPWGWNTPACAEQITQSQFHHICMFHPFVQLNHANVLLPKLCMNPWIRSAPKKQADLVVWCWLSTSP